MDSLEVVIQAALLMFAPLIRQNALNFRVSKIVQFAQAKSVATQIALSVHPLITLRYFVMIKHTAQIIARLDSTGLFPTLVKNRQITL